MRMLQTACIWPPELTVGLSPRYKPPHPNLKPHEVDKDSEETIRLTRQLKGLLNRSVEVYCPIYVADGNDKDE